MWIIKWYSLDFGVIDTIVVEKDTSAYGFNWKKIIKNNSYGFFVSGALLQEDTLIGKVWYHPLEPGIDTSYLAFNFDLEEGDTFDLSSNYDPCGLPTQNVGRAFERLVSYQFKSTLLPILLHNPAEIHTRSDAIRQIDAHRHRRLWLIKDESSMDVIELHVHSPELATFRFDH